MFERHRMHEIVRRFAELIVEMMSGAVIFRSDKEHFSTVLPFYFSGLRSRVSLHPAANMAHFEIMFFFEI